MSFALTLMKEFVKFAQRFFSLSCQARFFTCSKECASEKRKRTNLERYGVENSAQSSSVRKKISELKNSRTQEEVRATQEKMRASLISHYGVENPMQSEEIRKKTEDTLEKRYGSRNFGQGEKAREKARETNLKKYGFENSLQSPEVKEKIKETNLLKYGVENVLSSDEIRERIKKTNLEKYGVENVSQSSEIKQKIRETFLKNYGLPSVFLAPEIRRKVSETNLNKYGFANPMQNKDIQKKVEASILKKYGVKNIMQSEEFKKARSEAYFKEHGVRNPAELHIQNFQNYEDFRNFLLDNPKTIEELADYFNVTSHSIRRKVREEKLDSLVIGQYANSVKEARFYAQIKDLGVTIIRNDRKILEGRELDFYFPDFNLAVEISPTSTHKSLIGWGNTPGKDVNYHKEKFLKCAEKNIELITVFDWHPWDSIVEMIKHKLLTNERIFARKCEVHYTEKVSKELKELLGEWHVLGSPQMRRTYTVNFLTFNEQICGIALWNKNSESEVELKRLVFRPGFSVVGGASKLIKNYLRENSQIRKILTFSDCDLGQGSVYEALGFTQIVESKPGLNFYHIKEHMHVKNLSLVKQGADRLLRNFPNYTPVGVGDNLMSNQEIVEHYGFLPVYDCGYRKWEKIISK
jgi:hypothetical protein